MHKVLNDACQYVVAVMQFIGVALTIVILHAKYKLYIKKFIMQYGQFVVHSNIVSTAILLYSILNKLVRRVCNKSGKKTRFESKSMYETSSIQLLHQ